MKGMQKAVAMCMLGLLAFGAFSAVVPVLAQTSEGQDGDQTATQARTVYNYSYPKATADSENSFIVYTEKRLHKPGDEVRIQGSIWPGLLAEIDNPGTVLVQVWDSSATTIARLVTPINSDGRFSVNLSLLNDTEPGIYYIYPQVQLQVELGTLSADTVTKLQASSKFLVVNPSVFVVEAEGKEFEVDIASTSSVSGFAFDQDAKKISFKVEGADGSDGVTQATIPKPLLSGQMTVLIDGQAVRPESNAVIVSSDTDAGMTLEINYHHSERIMEVTGTNVVPEFPVLVVMAVAIGAMVIAVTVAARRGLMQSPEI